MRTATACVLLACLSPALAQEGVHRCLDPLGNPVYSDQPCEYLGAAPRGQPGLPVDAIGAGFSPPECARSPERLLQGVRSALELRDVNRLASYYHWTGTSAGGARFLMDELEAVAGRPLIALAWLAPEDGREHVDTGPDPAPIDPAVPAVPADPGVPAVPAVPAGPPTGLRLQLAAGLTDTGAVTVDFRLRQHAGCWWIEF